jgi:hypothetical protein
MKSLSAFILETSKDVMPAIERIRFIIVNKKQETKLTFLRRLILCLMDILISEQNSLHVKKQTELIQLIAKLMSWTSNPFKKLLVSEERSTFKSLAKRLGSLGDMDLQMEVRPGRRDQGTAIASI